jgi:histidine triad (HIT) family protein
VTAFHDQNPQAPVHVLIIPNRHIASVAEAKVEDEPVLGKLFTVARRVAKDLGVTDYRLVVNNGRQAGQSVFHLHLHLLGGRRMSWPPG